MQKANIFYENRGKKYNCRINGVPYFRKSAKIGDKLRTFYGDGEKECLAKIAAAKEAESAGLEYDYRNSKVGPTIKHWLMNVKRVDKNLKASSFSRYECAYRNQIVPFKDIYDTPLSKLTSAKMQEYVNRLAEEGDLSNDSIKSVLKVWKMFLEWAENEGYITKNPCKNLVIPGKRDKGKVKFETFDAEERKALVDRMTSEDYWYAQLILLAFDTGMRVGELLGLKWEDIRDEGIYVSRSTAVVTHVDKDGNHERFREVWDTKTVNSERFIPLRNTMLSLLSDYREDRKQYFKEKGIPVSDYVFTTLNGNMIDATSFTKSYRRLLERAGIKYRKFHAIRHTFATEALRQGINIKDLQMLMGHADIQTTLLYVQSSDESKREAINSMASLVGV